MELEFTADQAQLRDSIRAVLAEQSPIDAARALAEARDLGPDLWAIVTELGWPSLTVPESAGGIGMTAIEAGILAEELGRNLTTGPLLTTVTQFVPLVVATARAEQIEALLAPVASGAVRGTVAVAESSGGFRAGDIETTATRSPAGGWKFTGTKRFVMSAADANQIAVVARANDGFVVAVVDADAIAIEPMAAIDATRSYGSIDLLGVEVPGDRVLGPVDAAVIDRASEEATCGLALEMVGTAQSVFDVTLEFVKQRHQFGVPIGSFQAIKHKLADMLVALERARATSYFAALCIAEDDERRHTAVSVAKAAAGDCEQRFSKEGIQLHGGIGYTWEHDMHLYVKRLKASGALFGSASDHRANIADLLGV